MAADDDLHRSLERLVELGQNPEVNIRPVLLRVLVDLFMRKGQHSPGDLAQFEEIALKLLDDADEGTRMLVADKLARHPAVPGALVRRFLAEHGPAAAAVLEHARVDADTLAAAASWGTAEMAVALARRADLDRLLVETLAERPERDVVLALLLNTAAPIGRPTLQYLVRRVRGDEDLARAALCRAEAMPADLAPLFMLAAPEQRAAIILAARRDDLGPEIRRPTLTDRERDALARLERALMGPDQDSFDDAMASALGLTLADVWRILDDEHGDALAVALAAAGASVELAARAFILSGPSIGRSVGAVRRLTVVVDELGMRTAARLLAAMTGTSGRAGGRARSEPDSPTRRRGEGDGRSAQSAETAPPLQRRLQAGKHR